MSQGRTARALDEAVKPESWPAFCTESAEESEAAPGWAALPAPPP